MCPKSILFVIRGYFEISAFEIMRDQFVCEKRFVYIASVSFCFSFSLVTFWKDFGLCLYVCGTYKNLYYYRLR